jgi:hypothetical protein
MDPEEQRSSQEGGAIGGEEAQPRRKRDPFKNMEKVYSSDAAMRSKDLASRAQLKQIKKAGVRHSGKKVVTDDVKKLKSLAVEPTLAKGDDINFYIEPVRIEYYIPKESRFAVETRFLYVPLIDPVPRDSPDDTLLRGYMKQNRFIDLMEVMNEFPAHITAILDSYNNTLPLFESMSRALKDVGEDPENYRAVLYLCETLMEYEPTLASLEILGDFLSWNLNWLIRKMNSLRITFSCSDKVISFLIKKRNQYWEENDLEYDERFEILAALFYEQAYPNRSEHFESEDYFFDIFEGKGSRKSRY